MRRFLAPFAVLLAATSCTVEFMPPPEPAPAPANAEPVRSPCADATPANYDPDCLQPNPRERSLVGTPCALHPDVMLNLDVVRVLYGYSTPDACHESPGRFIHSRIAVSGGCVVGKPLTEVAYCSECRRVRSGGQAARTH